MWAIFVRNTFSRRPQKTAVYKKKECLIKKPAINTRLDSLNRIALTETRKTVTAIEIVMDFVVKNIILDRTLTNFLANEPHPIETLKIKKSNLPILSDFFPKNQHQLVKIDFSKCGIRTIMRNSFNCLANLNYLNLAVNKISDLNVNLFGKNTKLKFLYLNDNQLKKIDSRLFKNNLKLEILFLNNNYLKTFSNFKLPELKELYLTNNLLVNFDNNDFPKLDYLNLNINQVHVTKAMLQFLKNLSILWLSNNGIGSLEKQIFFMQNKLKYLYLDGNRLKLIDENLFPQHNQLAVWSLSRNEISIIHNQAFANLKSLKCLHLKKNQLESFNFSQLQFNDELSDLVLDDNYMGTMVRTNTETKNCSIEVLIIQNNQNRLILDANIFVNFSYLQKLLLKNSKIYKIQESTFNELKNLKFLDLSYNCLESLPDDCLPTETNIINFNLEFNNMTYLNADNFAPGTLLVTLNLSGNYYLTIDENAFENIASCLETLLLEKISFENHMLPKFSGLKHLKRLELISNRISGFPNFCFDQLLNLRYFTYSNNFDCSSVSSYFNFLQYPIISSENSLTSLSLQNCKIKRISTSCFMTLLKLEELNLSNNFLSELSESLFSYNLMLRELNLNFNPLGDFKTNHFRNNCQLNRLFLKCSPMTFLSAEHLNLVSLQLLVLSETCKCSTELLNLLTLKICFN